MSAAPILARTLKYQVRISRGEGAGTSFHFEQGVVTIGRGPENDIVLANDPKVSRQHLELRVQSGFLLARNISKKNFILVNGESVQEKLCDKSFKIQVGTTELDVQLELPTEQRLATEARHLRPVPQQSAPNVVKQNVSVTPAQSSMRMQAPPRPHPQMATVSGANGNSRMGFYVIVAVVLGLAVWLFSGSSSSKPKDSGLRSEADVLRSIEESANAVKELKQQRQKTGQDSMQYQLAEENYVKGFRDYLQGQYARAMVSFQAALSFYPAHEMARKYLVMSQRKFEESVDQSMSLGRNYYQRQNWRMCQSSFANVMIMLKDPMKAKYKEAKQIYDECGLRLGGGF